MGSTKSLRYEVLVYPKATSSAFREQQHQPTFLPNDDSSSNHAATGALFETKVQRFTCDRENMQQYWIPEGYHPVLIPRAYLTDNNFVAATSNNSTNPVSAGNVIRQLRINDNNELRRRRKFPLSNNNGGISKKKRINNVNRTILGQATPNVNNINRQLKEKISAIRNNAVSISSNSSLKNLPDNHSPSFIIGEMWKKEPENIKKHYERSSIRKKIAQALAYEKKFSSASVNNTLRRHPTNTGSSYRLSNAVEGVGGVGSSNFGNGHQNVDNSASALEKKSRPIPDWMTRSDDEDYDDENSSDLDATVAY